MPSGRPRSQEIVAVQGELDPLGALQYWPLRSLKDVIECY